MKMAAEKKYKMDMCHGPLFGKIVRFAVPLAMANALSLMFHAADIDDDLAVPRMLFAGSEHHSEHQHGAQQCNR